MAGLSPRTFAVLFPGQGNQMTGMARDIVSKVGAASQVFDLASDVLGIDARALCWDMPNSELKRTENAQPALVISSLACWSAFASTIEVDMSEMSVFAGHSLGALSAAAAAGFLSITDAIELSYERGRLMSMAPGEGSMLAISIPPEDSFEGQLNTARRLASRFDLEIAAVNGPKQVVLSGPSAAVHAAAATLGATSRELEVSHAFHSKFMIPVSSEWEELLRSRHWTPGRHTYIPNSLASATNDTTVVREDLESALYSPVYWSKVLAQIPPSARVVIPGAGQPIERLLRGVSAFSVHTVDSVRSLTRAVAA